MRAAYMPLESPHPGSAFPFLPFNPRWMFGLDLHERGYLSALLELSWCSDPPCFLPNQPERLCEMLKARYAHSSWGQPVPPRVLLRFRADPRTGRIYFPPLLAAYKFMLRAREPHDILRLGLV